MAVKLCSTSQWLYKSCWSDTEEEEAHQSTVDGDALFGSIACRSGSLQPLRTGQVHKVKLGCQRLVLIHLRVSIRDSVISLSFLLMDNDIHKHWLVTQLCAILAVSLSCFKWYRGCTNIVGGTDADLAQVDCEDGVRSRALDIHLRAGCGARQSPQL